MRSRLRYLSHLPITCQFQVAELALKSPTVSNSTLSHFHNDIEKRRKIRQKRMRDERQRCRKIQIAENKKIGICEYRVVLLETILNRGKSFLQTNTTTAMVCSQCPIPTPIQMIVKKIACVEFCGCYHNAQRRTSTVIAIGVCTHVMVSVSVSMSDSVNAPLPGCLIEGPWKLRSLHSRVEIIVVLFF